VGGILRVNHVFGNLKAFAPAVVAMKPRPSTTLSHFTKWDKDALVGLSFLAEIDVVAVLGKVRNS